MDRFGAEVVVLRTRREKIDIILEGLGIDILKQNGGDPFIVDFISKIIGSRFDRRSGYISGLLDYHSCIDIGFYKHLYRIEMGFPSEFNSTSSWVKKQSK